MSAVEPLWRGSPFTVRVISTSCGLATEAAGTNSESGQAVSKPLAISQGSPFFFCSACTSRSVRSMATP